jgi:hypothetical protein
MNNSRATNDRLSDLIRMELGSEYNSVDKTYTFNNKVYELTWRFVGGFEKTDSTRTINQMSPDSRKFHIICAEKEDGEYDFFVLSFIDVCYLATEKRPQHGGLTIERYNCSLNDIISNFKQATNLKDGMEDAIKSQEKHPSLKSLVQYLDSQRNIRAELNKQDMQMLKTFCS